MIKQIPKYSVATTPLPTFPKGNLNVYDVCPTRTAFFASIERVLLFYCYQVLRYTRRIPLFRVLRG